MNLSEKIILVAVPIILIIIFGYLLLLNYQTNLVFSLIAVLIGASISICSTILYNEHVVEQKRKEDEIIRQNYEKKALTALKSNLQENQQILMKNIQDLENEMKKSYENINRYSINPLKEFKSGFWEIIKLNAPNELNKPEIFDLLENSTFVMERINEYIRIKENYKIMNFHEGLDYENILKKYNSFLIDYHHKLQKLLQELFIMLNEK